MGSFHSEDVDELMLRKESSYSPPTLPFEYNILKSEDQEPEFLIDRSNWTFLNHGAFGAALNVGYRRAQQWRLHLERQPLRYFDRDLLPHLVYSARRIAHLCQASRESTTLIPNVTYGLNTILQGYSRVFQDNAQVVLWDTSYGSLKKMANEYCPGKVSEIQLSSRFHQWKSSFANNPSELFESLLTETLDAMDHTENALLVLDHTTSNTALNMPLELSSKLAKERGMLVLVDGAHGLGAQNVNLSQLPHVDFYLGNGHKWLSCPRGIGMLYCSSQDLRDSILRRPACMSHGMGQGFQSRFLWDGCRDYAAALSVPAVLDHWETSRPNGLVEVQHTIQNSLSNAVLTLQDMWETDTLAPLQVHAPMMALVELPGHLQKKNTRDDEKMLSTSEDAKRIQDYLFDQRIEVPIKCIEGRLYVRISCHIYNELTEYEELGRVLTAYHQSGER